MSKELEAWQKIKLGYICGQGAINEFALRENERENLKIIETALKDYEYQTKVLEKLTEPKLLTLSEKEIQEFKKSSGYIAEYKGVYVDENILKKLKAFDTMKEKGLDIREFRYCHSLYEYNICKNVGCRDLTQQEFDLLKEVLP